MLFKSHRYGPRSCHLASVGGLAQTARLSAAHRGHAGKDKLRTEMSAVRGQGARAADRHAGPRDAKQTDQVRRHSRQWVASVIDTFRTPPGKSLRAELSPKTTRPIDHCVSAIRSLRPYHPPLPLPGLLFLGKFRTSRTERV